MRIEKLKTDRNIKRLFAKILLLILVLGGFFVLSAGKAHATAGINEQLNYQGRLLNNLGAVVADGTYNIEFKIYQDGTGCVSGGSSPCGGTLKWTETRTGANKVTVTNGFFSVQLGAVTAFGTSVDWNQDTLWLSVNIGGTGAPSYDGEMTPFRRLSAVPYALNTKQLGGLDWSKFVQIAPTAVQVDSGTLSTVFLNKTGASGNILQLQKSGSNVVTINNSGGTTIDTSASAVTGLTVKAQTNQYTYQYLKSDGTNLLRGVWDTGNFHQYLGGTLYYNLGGNNFSIDGNGFSNTGLIISGGAELKLDPPITSSTPAMRIGGGSYATAGTPLTSQDGFWWSSWAWNGSNGFSITSRSILRQVQLSTTAGDAIIKLINNADAPVLTVGLLNGQISLGTNAVAANGVLTVGTNTTAATGGIYFGTDTNLYRSAASTLKTDSILAVGTMGTTNTANYLCLNASSQLAACNGTGTGVAFVQNGNSFGGTGTLGTNDSFGLAIETNNITQATIAVGGATAFQNSTNSTTAFQIKNAAGSTIVFDADTTNGRVGIGTASPTQVLEVNGNALFDLHSATGASNTINSVALLRPGSTGSVINGNAETYTSLNSFDYFLGTENYLLLKPSGAITGTHIVYASDSAAAIDPTSTADFTGQILVGARGVFDNYGSGNVNIQRGGDFAAGHYGTGTATTLEGIHVFTAATGPTTAMTALNVQNQFGGTASTATDSYGLNYLFSNTSTGTVTNTYGIQIKTPVNSGGGTITNNYGLYIQDHSSIGSTLSYNLYSAGASSKNFLQGKVGVGDSASVPTAALHINTTVAADLFKVTDATAAAVDVFKIADEGAVTIQNRTNSTAAYTIKNAAGTNFENIDTTASIVTIGNNTGATAVNINSGSSNINFQPGGTGTTGIVQLGVGGATGSATPDILALDTKSTTGDPTGVNGYMYYSVFNNTFRCFQNGAWTNCIGGGASVALSSITAASTTNTIDNLTFAQTWNWSTASTQNPLAITANALTTGAALGISTSSTGLTAAVTNTGSLLDLTESGAMTAFTGSLASINASGANTVGSTGNALNINVAGSAQIMKALNLADASTGAPTNGLVRFNFTGAHTANGFQVDDITATGTVMQLNASSLTTGYAENINVNGAAVLTTGGALNIVGPTGAANLTGGTGLLRVISTGATTGTAGAGTLFQLNGTGSITPTLASITDTSVMTTTGSLLTLTANSATTATGLVTLNSTGLTTGYAVNLLTNGAAVLTTGGALKITGPTGAANLTGGTGLLRVASTGATTGTAAAGTLFQLNGTGSITPTLASITDTSVMTTTGNLLTLAASGATTTTGLLTVNSAGLTTGYAENINVNGAAVLTTGGALNIVGPTGAAALAGGTGLVSINASGAFTTTAGAGGLLQVTANGTATGTVASITATGLTSGIGLTIAGPTTGATLTGNLLSVTTASTGASTAGFAQFNFSGAHTGAGVEIDDSTATGSALTINANAVTSGFVARFLNTGNVAGNNGIEVRSGQNTFSATSNLVTFTRPDGTTIGTIAENASTTVAYNTTSDERLKENIVDTHYSLDTVLNLKVHDYNYIADANQQQLTGFLAQELYAQFPGAVTVGDDTKDANGNLLHPWAVDYGKLTPLLAKGIQDLNTKVDTLEAKVNSQQLGQAAFNGGIVANNTEFQGKVVFDALTTFKGQSVFTGSATFDGPAIFNDKIVVSSNTAGTVKVLAGQTTLKIVFSKPYANPPVVNITPVGIIAPKYGVVNTSVNGFEIQIDPVQAIDTQFNWFAVEAQ